VSIYSDFETRIRQDLSDSGSPPLLSSTDLDRHVDHAVRDLALVAPIDVLLAVPLVSGSRQVDLTNALSPYKLIRLEAVEWPAGQYPQEFVQFNLFGGVDPVLTLLVEQAPVFPDNATVVRQSDFEDGTAQGWVATDGGSTVANDGAYAYSGSLSLAVTPDGANEGAVTAGDALTAELGYMASVWLYGTLGRSYELSCFRTDNSAVLASQTVTGTGGWQMLQASWIQPANATVKCEVLDTGTTPPEFFIDYFTLAQVVNSAQSFANLYCKVAPVVTGSTATSTLPPKYDDVIALGAAGYAAQELATRLMNTINIGGPVVWEHYIALSEKLLADFGTEIDIIAGRTQFFTQRMYSPEYPPQGISQTEVYPPGEPWP